MNKPRSDDDPALVPIWPYQSTYLYSHLDIAIYIHPALVEGWFTWVRNHSLKSLQFELDRAYHTCPQLSTARRICESSPWPSISISNLLLQHRHFRPQDQMLTYVNQLILLTQLSI